MRRLAIVMLLGAVVFAPHRALAAIFTVDSTDDGVDTSAPGDGVCSTPKRTCTLRAAVMEANALPGRDTIIVPAGRFTLRFRGPSEDRAWRGDLDITDDVEIIGAGETATIIDGNRIDRVFDVHDPAQATISDLTIANGEPQGTVASRLSGYSYYSARGSGDGGGLYSDGTITLRNVTFLGNRAGRGEGYGGGLVNAGTATLTHVTFLHNRAGDWVCANPYGYPARRGGEYGCSYGSYGTEAGSAGGMWNLGTATLTNVVFRGNRAGDMQNDSADAAGNGGGMQNDGDATLTDVTFVLNRAGNGGRNGQVTGGAGGGLYHFYGTMTLTRVTFERNRAGKSSTRSDGGGNGGDGGGMSTDIDGTAFLTDVRFTGNRAGDGSGFYGGEGGSGGGLANGESMVITNATFDGNRAGDGYWGGGEGGGIDDGGDLTLTNVTIVRNRAGNSSGLYPGGDGGGLATDDPPLTNVTLAFNRAGINLRTHRAADGGIGQQLAADGAAVTNTIIVGAGQSCSDPLTSQGHNLDSGDSCGFTALADLQDTDPRLDTLKDNGGFTPTLAVRPGSPAIDAGDNAACPATDQRGVTRPQGAACDIGAYEFAP